MLIIDEVYSSLCKCIFLNNFIAKVTDPYAKCDDLDFLLSYSSVKLKAKAV